MVNSTAVIMIELTAVTVSPNNSFDGTSSVLKIISIRDTRFIDYSQLFYQQDDGSFLEVIQQYGVILGKIAIL